VAAFAASLAMHAAFAAAIALFATAALEPEREHLMLVRLLEPAATPGERSASAPAAAEPAAAARRPKPVAPVRASKPAPARAPEPRPAPAPAPPSEPGLAAEAAPAVGAGDDAQADVAAAPPVLAALPPGAGSGGGSADAAIDAYIAELRGLVGRAQRYPALARRHHLEGVVLVRLVIQADGSVERADADDAAPELLAQSALDAIERASPFPPPPSAPFHVELPIRWRLGG